MQLRGWQSMMTPHTASPFLGRVGLAGSVSLGQSPAELVKWYQRAKAAVAKYAALLGRTDRVANATERANVRAWLGDPANPSAPAYRYASVLSDLAENVEAFTPINYGAYQVERRRNRIEALEDYNRDFEAKVVNAERVYGILPAPQVIRERVEVPGPTVTMPGAAPDLTIPILVAGGAVALVLLLG